jgi:hypothetical protein
LRCAHSLQPADECILERHRPALETTTPSTIIIIINIITNCTINTINRLHRNVRRRTAFDAPQNQTRFTDKPLPPPLQAITWPKMNANRQPDFLAVVVVCSTEKQTQRPLTFTRHIPLLPCFTSLPLLIHSRMTTRFAQPDA